MTTTPLPPDRESLPPPAGPDPATRAGLRDRAFAAGAEPRIDAPWLERGVALLDRSAEQLDAATLSRLNRARHAALAVRRSRRTEWMLGGSLATAALALVLALGLQHRAPRPAPAGDAAPAGGETAMLADDDTLDFYEDLDFYAWLDAEQPEHRQ